MRHDYVRVRFVLGWIRVLFGWVRVRVRVWLGLVRYWVGLCACDEGFDAETEAE